MEIVRFDVLVSEHDNDPPIEVVEEFLREQGYHYWRLEK